MVDVTDSTFKKEVIEASKNMPIVVDFWAPWCGPCMMLKPIMEKLSADYKGKAVIAKLNVDENQETAQQYDIMSIPAVKLFRNGEVVDEFVGARPESAIKEWINSHLK
jgi:thioredoxin